MKNYLSLTFIFVFMFLSWFGFSQNNEILLWKNIPGEIVSKDYNTLAKRPTYSVLDTSKISKEFELKIPGWKESLLVALSKV